MPTSSQERRTVVAQTYMTIRYAREFGALMALARQRQPRAGHSRQWDLAVSWLCLEHWEEYQRMTTTQKERD